MMSVVIPTLGKWLHFVSCQSNKRLLLYYTRSLCRRRLYMNL